MRKTSKPVKIAPKYFGHSEVKEHIANDGVLPPASFGGRVRRATPTCMLQAASLAPLLWLAASQAMGQEPVRHPHGQDHSAVHFPITCAPEVQDVFDRAVATLHSFDYEEARRGFHAVAQRDPACGMAWWGVAMTFYHQHWDQPTPAELSAGRAAAETAARLGGGLDRERAYISAIGAFYSDVDRLDHGTRTLSYKAAMERLAARFPEDTEASIFYALSLLAAREPNDTAYSSQRRAAEILTRLLPAHADHPGIAHYTIHAFDYPGLAELALPAARIYARLAPASPHALHMPSHIFTRLGLWEESIRSNLAVVRAAREQASRADPATFAFEALHALDYLAYAYLQLGDIQRAGGVVEEVATAKRFNEPNFQVGYALTSIPARYAVERRDWEMAATLSPPAVDLPWDDFVYARGNTYYANAIGAARAGKVDRARQAVREIADLQSALAAAPPRGPYDWAGRFEAMRLAGAGWLAYAENRPEEAVRLLTRAAEMEERVGKHPVTPGPILPAREQLGDLLLELGRPADALAAYEASLEVSPERYNGLLGAKRAAERAGLPAKARENTPRLR